MSEALEAYLWGTVCLLSASPDEEDRILDAMDAMFDALSAGDLLKLTMRWAAQDLGVARG